MAIKRVWVEDTCIGCGLAEATVPEVFVLEDLQNTVASHLADPNEFAEQIKHMADKCPVGAIKYEEE